MEFLKRSVRRLLTPPNAIIVTYHSVLDRNPPFPVWQHILVQQFEEQLRWLAGHCRLISMSELLGALATGSVARNSVVVTFDDGFANNLSTVLPLLERYQVPATFFITTGCIGSERLMWPETIASIVAASRQNCLHHNGTDYPLESVAARATAYKAIARQVKLLAGDAREQALLAVARGAGLEEREWMSGAFAERARMLSWDELRQLASSRWVEIGAHTVNHPQLAGLPDDDARFEITSCKHVLEQQLGMPVRYFAYPYGGQTDYLPRHRAMAIEAGYEALVTTDESCVFAGTSALSLPRLGIGDEATLAGVAYEVGGGLAWRAKRRRS